MPRANPHVMIVKTIASKIGVYSSSNGQLMKTFCEYAGVFRNDKVRSRLNYLSAATFSTAARSVLCFTDGRPAGSRMRLPLMNKAEPFFSTTKPTDLLLR